MIAGLLLVPALMAQQPTAPAPAPKIARIAITPATLTLRINDTATVAATAYDSAGNRLAVPLTFISFNRRAVGVDSLGHVKAYRAGNQPVQIVALNLDAGFALRGTANVTVNWPGLARVEVQGSPRMFAGTTERSRARVVDSAGVARDNVTIVWVSDNPSVASADHSAPAWPRSVPPAAGSPGDSVSPSCQIPLAR